MPRLYVDDGCSVRAAAFDRDLSYHIKMHAAVLARYASFSAPPLAASAGLPPVREHSFAVIFANIIFTPFILCVGCRRG